MIGFNYRRIPAFALAKDLISEGRLGAVRHVRIACVQDWLADESGTMNGPLGNESAGSASWVILPATPSI
jgi:predicted dehydrogenase